MSGEQGVSSLPAEGWYKDPAKSRGQRKWDGEKWTEQTRARRGFAKRSAPNRLVTAIKNLFALSVAAAIIGGLIFFGIRAAEIENSREGNGTGAPAETPAGAETPAVVSEPAADPISVLPE